jgi:hypothetical protein
MRDDGATDCETLGAAVALGAWATHAARAFARLRTAEAPASVDWCEPNRTAPGAAAEPWNTWSMVPGLLLMLAHLVRSAGRAARARGPRGGGVADAYAAAAFALALWLSAGSLAFHATLTRHWQAHDELPMLYLGVWAALCVRRGAVVSHRRRRLTASTLSTDLVLFACAGTVVTEAYAGTAAAYAWFVVPYAALTSATLLALGRRLLLAPPPAAVAPRAWRLCCRRGAAGIGLMAVGAVAWVADNRQCGDASPPPYAYVPWHAAWHLLVAAAKHALIPCVVDLLRDHAPGRTGPAGPAVTPRAA